MPLQINHVEAKGIYSRLSMSVDFHPDLTILFGQNGTGKTTLLHILMNILQGSLDRFAFLNFESIRVETSEGDVSLVKRENKISVRKSGRKYELDCEEMRKHFREHPESILPGPDDWFSDKPSYFPAFRTMVEAWGSVREEARARTYWRGGEDVPAEQTRRQRLTVAARHLFGDFVPVLAYPSPTDIQRDLSEHLRTAAFTVARHNELALSSGFIEAFSALSQAEVPRESSESILADIQSLLVQLSAADVPGRPRQAEGPDVYTRLQQVLPRIKASELPAGVASVLSVYRAALREQVENQRTAFEPIKRYLEAVNDFLEGKSVEAATIGTARASVRVRFGDGLAPLKALSSGERQILSMLYAALYDDSAGPVLIDEPEISLHIDWQRRLLHKMQPHLAKRQIVVCTHSPEIAADYEDRYKEVVPLVRGSLTTSE